METDGSKIGYACVVAQQFPNQRTISFQCNFAQGASAEEINAEMDKLAAVLDRQAMKIEIPNLKHNIEAKKRTLRTNEEQIAAFNTRIADQSIGQGKNSPSVKQLENSLAQAKTTYDELKRRIAEEEAALVELEQKAT